MDLAGSGLHWDGLFLVGSEKIENTCSLAFCPGGVRSLFGGSGLCSSSRIVEGSGGFGGRDGTD